MCQLHVRSLRLDIGSNVMWRCSTKPLCCKRSFMCSLDRLAQKCRPLVKGACVSSFALCSNALSVEHECTEYVNAGRELCEVGSKNKFDVPSSKAIQNPVPASRLRGGCTCEQCARATAFSHFQSLRVLRNRTHGNGHHDHDDVFYIKATFYTSCNMWPILNTYLCNASTLAVLSKDDTYVPHGLGDACACTSSALFRDSLH
eukprot:1529127-Amphidinium_carterae.1